MKIGCIIQTRLSSTRLYKKVLLELPNGSGVTVLENVVRRVKISKKISEIIIATTINRLDDKIEEEAIKLGVKFYRGSEDNVLERYYLAAKRENLDYIIRVTSDCPCIDSDIIDEIIEKHLKEENDYTSNTLKRSYPHGLDVEIFNFKVLEEAYKNSTEKFEKEHVTPYIYKTSVENYKIGELVVEESYFSPNIRVTLDTKEDYTLLQAVYDYLYKDNEYFTYKEIVKLFEKKRWLYEINSSIEQKKVCKNLEEEIKEAMKLLEKQDLNRAKDYLESKYYGD